MQQNMVLLIIFCVGLVCLYPTGASSASSETGYERKLQSILLFARLSEWPPEAFAAPKDPFILGVLGENLTAPNIEQLGNKKVSGREVRVVRYSPEDDFTRSHLLFVGDSDPGRIASVLSRLHGLPVMTASDMEGFAESGGMFELVTQNEKVRFKLNQDAAKASGIKIGIKVVKLGEIVHTRATPAPVAEPIRLVILPALENSNLGTGWAQGLYPPFLSDELYEISVAADPKLAKKLRAQELKIGSRERKRLWSGGNQQVHGKPRLDAVRAAVAGLDIDGVLMHSTNNDGIGAGGRGSVRVFLLDLNSGELHHADRALTSVGGSDVSKDVTDVAVGLVHENLGGVVNQHQIRVAILPARHFIIDDVGHREFFRQGLYYLPLKSNADYSVEAATDKKLAGKLGIATLELGKSLKEAIWSRAGSQQHAEPKLDAIRKAVKGLNVKAVLMYSALSFGKQVRLYLVDIETGRIFKLEGRLDDRSVPTLQLKDLMDRLLATSKEDLRDPTVRLALLPARVKAIGGEHFDNSEIADDVYRPFAKYSGLTITHADSALAKTLQAMPLKMDHSSSEKLWRPAEDYEHAEPDLAAIKGALKGLGTRAAITYSMPDHGGWPIPYPLRIYLIDVQTDKVYQVDGKLKVTGAAGHSKQIKGLTDKLVRTYLNDLNRIQTSESASKRTKRRSTTKNLQ